VPPAGTDGMKIRFPTTSSRSTTASHLYDNDNRTGVDVRIEPMYIPPTGQPTDQTQAPLPSPEAVEVPGVGGRFAYFNACIIELRFA
jgi:hypothetical protein